MTIERRMQLDLRATVDLHLANGWVIVSREPIVLEKGEESMRLDDGVLKPVTAETENH